VTFPFASTLLAGVAAITSTKRKVRAFKAGFPDEATHVVFASGGGSKAKG
jgi:hypothetical protein